MNRNKLFKQLKDIQSGQTELTVEHDLLSYSIKHSFIPKDAISTFQEATSAFKLIENYQSCLDGDIKNISENKQVSHHHLRIKSSALFDKANTQKLDPLINKINESPSKITTIVQIGIGGSSVGPKLLYSSILSYMKKNNKEPLRKGIIISHLDPLELSEKLFPLNPQNTLIIIASKSGNTQETCLNLERIQLWWKEHNFSENEQKNHLLILTTRDSPLDNPQLTLNRFFINDSVGGRFSCTSIIGTTLIRLCFGDTVYRDMLDGAFEIDQNSLLPSIKDNVALCAAWSTIWFVNCMNYFSFGVIAYSYALSHLHTFVQQLECESNGKRVDINDKTCDYNTAPIVFGGSGTNAQHSFFQLLHQGSTTVPIEFVGIKESNFTQAIEQKACKALNANLYGQIESLQKGNNAENPASLCPGKKPSTLLLLNSLTPKCIGALIAFYENKIMFEGFIWNINSFDQEGVKLGKQNTEKILNQPSN